jgi:hypothetical protein
LYLKISNSSENVSTRMLWKIHFVLFLIISFIYIYIYICLRQVTTIQWFTSLDCKRIPGCIKYFLYKRLNVQPNNVKVRYWDERYFFCPISRIWTHTICTLLSKMTNYLASLSKSTIHHNIYIIILNSLSWL